MDQLHLQSLPLSTLHALAWLLLVVVLFAPLEWLFAVHRQKTFRKSIVGDIGYFFISNFIPKFILAVPLAVAALAAYRLVPGSVHAAVETWPLWLRGLSAFVVADFGFYWGHRWAHQVPFLWRFHVVHHAPEHVYFLISARAHPVDNAFIRLCGLVPIYILGLGAPQSVKGTLVATMLMLVLTIWGFFIHANLRWRYGPLEWLLATPPFHLWHHTLSEPRNRNFASMLPCWDWMFGTLYLPSRQWPSAYGVEDKLPASVVGQLLYPFMPPARTPAAQPAATSQPAATNPG